MISRQRVTWIPAFAGMTVLLFSLSAQAVDLGLAKEDAGHAGAFLDFAASARSLAMGRAQVGATNDAGSTYWNPAGLTQLDRKNLSGLYSLLQEDTGFGVVNFAVPTLDYGTFGFSLVSLQSKDFEKRVDGLPLGTYDQSETGVLLADGFQLSQKLSLGLTFKVVNQKIDSFSGTGYGADLGMLYAFHPNLSVGASARNLWAPKLKLRNESDTYPRDIRVGAKIQATNHILVATDLIQTENRVLKLNVGSEWLINNLLALRAGFNDTELTGGLGLKFGDWGLDYAFGYQQSVGGVDGLGGSHRIGFTMSFGEKVSDSGFSLRWQRKGKLVLELLKQQMNAGQQPLSPDVQNIVQAGQEVIANQGYTKAQDLYSAQGYISFFKGEFERSVQSLGEALVLDPSDADLAGHLQNARRHMTEEQTKRIVAQEMKIGRELYEKSDYPGAVMVFQKVLNFMPDHVEAATYLEDAKRRIDEPIMRELKIARTKIEREEYLDAIKHLQAVKQKDPKNQEADKLMAESIEALEKKARLQYKEKKVVYEVQAESNESRKLYSQGLMLYSRGKLDEAVALWGKAIDLDGDNQLARNAYNRGIAELQESKNP